MNYNISETPREFKPIQLNITFHSIEELELYHSLLEKAEYLQRQTSQTENIMLICIAIEKILKQFTNK